MQVTMWAWCCHLSASTTSTCTLTSSTTPTCISGSTCSLDTTPLVSSPAQVQLLQYVFCPHPCHASPPPRVQPYLLCCYACSSIPAVCTVHGSVKYPHYLCLHQLLGILREPMSCFVCTHAGMLCSIIVWSLYFPSCS